MAGYMGQLGLACSWIPRREIEPQLLVAPSVSSEACTLNCITKCLQVIPNEDELSRNIQCYLAPLKLLSVH